MNGLFVYLVLCAYRSGCATIPIPMTDQTCAREQAKAEKQWDLAYCVDTQGISK